jgi:endonuclease YncB( thermonuclease family)
VKITHAFLKASYVALAAVLIAFAFSGHAMADDDISGSAFVQEDSTLRINGNIIHLYGIYIPPTDHTCTTFMRPMPCGTRASLALDFKITGDSVHCVTMGSNADGSLIGNCSAGGDNLSAWMLQRGWAVALSNAPFEFGAMEKIAQFKGLGIWGIPVDNVRRHR